MTLRNTAWFLGPCVIATAFGLVSAVARHRDPPTRYNGIDRRGIHQRETAVHRDIPRSKGATFVVRRLPSPAATSDIMEMETCRLIR